MRRRPVIERPREFDETISIDSDELRVVDDALR